MATVSFIPESHQSISAMKAVIDYCSQQKKVADADSGRRLVGGVNCNGENAFTEFMATKTAHHKKGGMINGRIRRYFTARKELTVGSITAKDIEDFYDWMFDSHVVANTVIHYHTVLHSAFKRAFKDGLIDSNPFDRIDRPKKNKFTGENYSEEELIAMLGLIRGDIIYPAVMLAGGLGLRRSEALGARWSRVDWEKKTILLDTKIIEYKENGKVIVEPVEEMKNKSSRRTLPRRTRCMKCCARNGKSKTCTAECSRAATTANTTIISAPISSAG